jgi:hypothetical protein
MKNKKDEWLERLVKEFKVQPAPLGKSEAKILTERQLKIISKKE